MNALPNELIDIIFEFVPSIGLHVSRKYDKASVVGDHYMTIKHFFVNERRQSETIEKLKMMEEYIDSTMPEFVNYDNIKQYSDDVIEYVQQNIKDCDMFSVKYICDLLDCYHGYFVEYMPYFGRTNLVKTYIKYMYFTYKDSEVFSYDDVASDIDSIPYIDDNNEKIMKKMMPYNGYLVDLLYGRTRLSTNMKKMIIKSLYSYSRFVGLRPKDYRKKRMLIDI